MCQYCGFPVWGGPDHPECAVERKRRIDGGLCFACGEDDSLGPDRDDLCNRCWVNGQHDVVRSTGYPGSD